MNLSIILLTHAFALLSIISTLAIASAPVLDWSGQPIKVNVPYQIWGVGNGRGPIGIGRSTLVTQKKNYVINKPHREPNPYSPDFIIFYPADPLETLVRIDKDYNIGFDTESQNISKYPFNMWRVDIDEGNKDYNFLTTGGQKGNPGCWNVNSWFQLAPVDEASYQYKIISNPQVCEPRQIPDEVTSIRRDGEDRLYLNKDNHVSSVAVTVRLGRASNIRQVVGMNFP